MLDCGLFHAFDGEERPAYVASLASVTEHHGIVYVLCFSDQGPDIGPHPVSQHPVSQHELRAAFTPANGWNIASIKPDRIHARFHDLFNENSASAWLATIHRI